MINLYKSDTGQYVLVHAPTQTVIIDENVGDAFEKMQDFLKEHHPDLAAQITRPFEGRPDSPPQQGRFARYALIALLCLLPFLWLATLHYSINSVLDELLLQRSRDGVTVEQLQDLKGKIDSLRLEVNQLSAK